MGKSYFILNHCSTKSMLHTCCSGCMSSETTVGDLLLSSPPTLIGSQRRKTPRTTCKLTSHRVHHSIFNLCHSLCCQRQMGKCNFVLDRYQGEKVSLLILESNSIFGSLCLLEWASCSYEHRSDFFARDGSKRDNLDPPLIQ